MKCFLSSGFVNDPTFVLIQVVEHNKLVKGITSQCKVVLIQVVEHNKLVKGITSQCKGWAAY